MQTTVDVRPVIKNQILRINYGAYASALRAENYNWTLLHEIQKPLDCPQILPLGVDNRSPGKHVQTTCCVPFAFVPLIYANVHSSL
jgi:hypothetical protein